MVPPRPNHNFHSSKGSATQPDNLFWVHLTIGMECIFLLLRKNKKGQGRKLSYPQEKNKLVQWLLELGDYDKKGLAKERPFHHLAMQCIF